MAVVATRWLGFCDRCDQPAPDERSTREEAEQDARDCPCESDAALAVEEATDPVEDKVVDIMAALEQSIADAKAARRRQQAERA